ncbi:uncharacterized protein LOC126253090 [Schistocerca nitens]|uniref:uncharacterized protein LOC126253090 n=1 Tax=Schistocerca nitens TaxID=7011 RepID=UPI002119459E|nr:uncharacterized protein LOC126253090 [Schistocerca nitens]XP_049810149.1 uncharacterized protein LOC126253090 [Schistocerca nitens]XP_049810150.1 uncharacterized protein LOC126253090 [Schistocerca nitens]
MAATVNSAGQKPVSVGVFVDVPNSTPISPVQLSANDIRMPQESGSQNIANGDAATLPLPTPNFSIPPHLMGRNIENPAEDLVTRGRKPQKPRLGVKVPYRNLTSQIVTQDELAQELLERSLKKYPVHDTPEGGDIFFAIKLTQRLANHIAPSSSSSSGATAAQPTDVLPKTDLSVKSGNIVSEKNSSAQEQKVIADDKELLAILEGDVDPNWIPEIKATPQCQLQRTVPSTVPTNGNHFTTPPKLDPLLEKELALKQLMEFETTPRKKKTDKLQEKSPKKPKQNVKKPAIDALTENNAHNVTTEVKKVPKENDVAELKKKKNRKRKAVVVASDNVKKKKLSTKNVSENIENGRADRNKVKKLQKDSKKINSTDKKISENVVKVIESVVKSSAEMEKINESQSSVQDTKCDLPDKPSEVDTKGLHRESSVENVKNHLDKNKASVEDAVSTNAVPNNENNTPVSEVSNLKNRADNSERNIGRGINKDNGEDQKLPDASSGSKKRCRRSEVDKLLIDEGAINLLYEAELGDSRRRSAVCDNDVSSNNNLKKPIKPKLNSSRWKKKNLLLKTRLVKNAVLRLKSLQNPAVNLRAKRQLLCTSDHQQSADSKMAPPKRMESRETLRSPPPSTVHFDPPSPTQSLPCPPRLQLRAEASRIIRRHSSSSNFSSRSTSPTVIPRTSCDTGINQHKSEYTSDGQSAKKVVYESQLKSITKQGAEARKKGVPIFIRKAEPLQTYKDKKGKEKEFNGTVSIQKEVTGASKSAKTSSTRIADSKTLPRLKTSISQKEHESKEVLLPNAPKNVSLDKSKFNPDVTKMHQKNSHKEKLPKSAKLSEENSVMKAKKKDRTQKSEVTGMPVVVSSSLEKSPVSATDVEAELTTCLAEAASAFAAEDRSLQVSSSGQNTQVVARSKLSTPNPAQKKDTNRSHPQSPNAASYVTLVKTLENDVQKQKRKDDEHAKSRTSIRQNAGTVSYRELSIRRYNGLVQIIMNPASTKMKNALNLQVLRELRGALSQMKRDDSCRAVLLTSTGGLFCQGVDLHCVLLSNIERRKAVAQEFAFAIKDFVRTLAHFNKPLIAGVNGAAVGLGVTMLPFFDMVIASDKATFYTPYAKLGQVPEGGATMTFQYMFGNCLTSELLFGCRRITASEALHFGLVTRILWPDRFQEELIPIVRGVSAQSTQAMEATKALLRHGLRTKLEASLESEIHLLVQHWCTTECQNNIRNFLEAYEEISLQRQRIDPDL